jgi:hypothetical protein
VQEAVREARQDQQKVLLQTMPQVWQIPALLQALLHKVSVWQQDLQEALLEIHGVHHQMVQAQVHESEMQEALWAPQQACVHQACEGEVYQQEMREARLEVPPHEDVHRQRQEEVQERDEMREKSEEVRQ